MNENFGHKFVWQRQNRVPAGIEPLLRPRFSVSQCGNGALEIQNFSIYSCNMRAIHFKGAEHGWTCGELRLRCLKDYSVTCTADFSSA
jgi:hypothetical protein